MHSLCSYVVVKRVIVVRPSAPREAGRDCPASRVLLSYSLICALLQPNFFVTNQRAQDGYIYTDTHTQGRIHTHLASLACVVSCWRLVARLCWLSASCSGVCCRRLAASLCRFARSLCVCFGGGGVLSGVSECIHCARMWWLNALSYYARQRRAKPVRIVLPCVCCYRTN